MLIKAKSEHGFDETINIIVDFLKSRGIKIFSVIDHKKNAGDVGLTMENEAVIIFGSPVTGTLLMKENPEIGIDLPAKLLVYSTNNDVYLLYKDPDTMIDFYGIRESKDALKKLKLLYQLAVNQVA
jgi:uncharacterized protein (DUF302 family)